jgi:HEPN domain-containing protein
MATPEKTALTVLREWITKAENDLKAAGHILKLGKDAPTDTVGFHAQQCVEKYLKAGLIHQGIAVPKTHKIQALVKLLPPKWRPKLSAQEQRKLTRYAAVTRYPEAGLAISLVDARQAVALARRVRQEIRRSFPRAAIRRR